MKTREISNSDDVIDSRAVIARIEALQEEREPLQDEVDAIDKSADIEEDAQAKLDALAEWDEDNGHELETLVSLSDEAEGYSGDWKYGATLIRDSYFVKAMQEMVQDIGDLPKDIPSYLEIDWEKTADNLRADYASVDFDGETYWIR